MSSSGQDFNAQVIEEFRASSGHVGGMLEQMQLVLLHHVGARSGTSYVTPLAYLADGGRYVIFASKAGAPDNPAWYHNLKANPRTQIEVGTETVDVVAQETTGAERDRLFGTMAERSPGFADYERKTDRVIPVIALAPADRS